MQIRQFIKLLDVELPLAAAMVDDPAGMQVLPEDRTLTKIGVAYELNEQVVRECAERGAELIITFHPLIYPSVRTIDRESRVGRVLVDLIRENIGLYVVHTAFDSHPDGTNSLLARELGCIDISPLFPDPDRPKFGIGRRGTFDRPIELKELAGRLKQVCDTPVVRVSGSSPEDMNRMVQSVGIIGGSGMSMYSAASGLDIDLLITADARYHAFHGANDGLIIMDPGHAESERFVEVGLTDLVSRVAKEGAPNVEVFATKITTNPIHYFV